MNYRHAFHAGNFADLVKHAVLLDFLARLTSQAGALTVIDTHAGRGVYDLQGEEARKSGEAEAGILRLMAAGDAPEAFMPLRRAVAKLNAGGPVRRYPGSPWLIAEALRPSDSYLACELRGEEHAALSLALANRPNVKALCADGYEIARTRSPSQGRVLVLIDPPFERADDYARIGETGAAVLGSNPGAVLMVWLPLKDLATFDAFLGDFEDAVGTGVLVAECRMRPLTDPMKMNGCALALVNAPVDVQRPLDELCRWTAEALGEGGEGRVYSV